MFGESESESPRVPSPWDSLISASPSPAPGSRSHTPSPLAAGPIPCLVAESDDGNVEYKLQLLNPSPARFARLVTQMKWRLLEGGGQAYYELGVADSGDLIGLPREDLEQSLETLEMMAGEIGASVIVVKEVEVPAALSRIAKRSGDNNSRRRNNNHRDADDDYSSSAFTTETEGSRSASDVDFTDGADDLSSTVVLPPRSGSSGVYPDDASTTSSFPVFTMDPESDTDSPAPRFVIDLEIASVFKPRPVRTGIHGVHNHLLVGGKNKRTKKHKPDVTNGHGQHTDEAKEMRHNKAHNRRQARDKKRDEKRKSLMALAALSVEGSQAGPTPDDPVAMISAPIPVSAINETPNIISVFESLNLKVDDEPIPSCTVVESVVIVEEAIPEITIVDDNDDDDVFPATAKPSYPTFAATGTAESHLDVDLVAVKLAGTLGSGASSDDQDEQPKLIVEALVVRKMSLEEGFLDFGGFGVS